MGLIEKEKVIKRIKAQIAVCKEIDSDWISLTVGTGKRILELLDGPEVVRCKDCHYGIRSSKDDIFCIKAIYVDKYKRPDWFCADGERK